MTTTLYFHAVDSTISGTLPTSKQSTQSTTLSMDSAATAKRSMDTTVGTTTGGGGITSSTMTSASQTGIFVTRFISLALSPQTISANTWTLGIGAVGSATTVIFPTNSSGFIPSALYVWRPSTGAKVGSIFDALSATAGSAAGKTSPKTSYVTFTGSAVTSSAGDVLIFEQLGMYKSSSSGQVLYYFDGSTAVTADNVGLSSNPASFISTPQILSFGGGGTVDTTVTGKTFTEKRIRNKH